MKPLAVFDIDGVLADVAHRLHHVQDKPKNWRAFFAAADGDGLLAAGAQLLHEVAPTHEIRYLTGRPERLRRITRDWLSQHGLPAADLVMRPNRDFRPSRVFKRDHLQQWLAEGSQIAVVVDDDPQVAAMVRELGLPIVQADWQHSPAAEQQTLWQVQEDLGRN